MNDLLKREASTRSAALLRIAIVLLIWSRWAAELTFAATPNSWLSAGFFAATFCLLIGAWTRVAAVATAIAVSVLYFWYGAYLGRAVWIHHHHYLLVSAAWVCALTPCGRSYAVDAWRTGLPERGPVWALRLYTIQLAAVYLWSGVDKISPAFLGGARLEQIAMSLYFGSDPPEWHMVAVAGAWLVTLLELALGVAFLLGRTPPWLLLSGVALHAALYVCMPVATFSATMVCLYLAALDPEAVHRATNGEHGSVALGQQLALGAAAGAAAVQDARAGGEAGGEIGARDDCAGVAGGTIDAAGRSEATQSFRGSGTARAL